MGQTGHHVRYWFSVCSNIQGTTLGDGFHTFWLDWTENNIILGFDNSTVLNVPTPPGGFRNNTNLNGSHIWDNGPLNAPFDQSFYLILNVAVGGKWFAPSYINYPYKQPWTTGASDDYFQFWEGRDLWLPTWHDEDIAMKVKSVKMVQY
ncbi:hypothetical protein V1264_020395 [Littorina saxatilis]|uniref:GH16 domain-containing protein n=1 Tax=Littorina saxatilis TaxID=31220 RepID=A0AAN9BAV0_9CAEN